MNTISINELTCPSNHYCPVINVCPADAIDQEGPFSAPQINDEKCSVCGKCLKLCPYGAFQINKN
ncbi:4Fe-4S binding protein [Bacteroidota bacterium]